MEKQIRRLGGNQEPRNSNNHVHVVDNNDAYSRVEVCGKQYGTLRAGVRYIRTLISAYNQQFQLPYQRPSSSADCARELFMAQTDRPA